jgi:hypothetical protein
VTVYEGSLDKSETDEAVVRAAVTGSDKAEAGCSLAVDGVVFQTMEDLLGHGLCLFAGGVISSSSCAERLWLAEVGAGMVGT